MTVSKKLTSDSIESSATNESTRTRVDLGTWRVGIVSSDDTNEI